MRQANTDKYVCIAMLVIFLYTFFIIGASYTYCEDLPYWGYKCREKEIIALEWSTAVFISPVAFLTFFFFMVFHKELVPINRKSVKKQIKAVFKYAKWKYNDGKKKLEIWKALP